MLLVDCERGIVQKAIDEAKFRRFFEISRIYTQLHESIEFHYYVDHVAIEFTHKDGKTYKEFEGETYEEAAITAVDYFTDEILEKKEWKK